MYHPTIKTTSNSQLKTLKNLRNNAKICKTAAHYFVKMVELHASVDLYTWTEDGYRDHCRVQACGLVRSWFLPTIWKRGMIHNVAQKISKNEMNLYSVTIERQSFDLRGDFNPELWLPLAQHNHHLANDCVQDVLKLKPFCLQLQLPASFFSDSKCKTTTVVEEDSI